jgi:hypothetical protein
MPKDGLDLCCAVGGGACALSNAGYHRNTLVLKNPLFSDFRRFRANVTYKKQ